MRESRLRCDVPAPESHGPLLLPRLCVGLEARHAELREPRVPEAVHGEGVARAPGRPAAVLRLVVPEHGRAERHFRGAQQGRQERRGDALRRVLASGDGAVPRHEPDGRAFKWGYKLGYCRKARRVEAAKAKAAA